MMRRLYYVTCDVCGSPAGDSDDLADRVQEARRVAESLGWWMASKHPDHAMDLCPSCTSQSNLVVHAPAEGDPHE